MAERLKILDIGPGRHPIFRADVLMPEGTKRGLRVIRGTRHVGRWGYDRIPVPKNTYDIVHSSHVLEHIPWHRTNRALKEAKRVLKPGGAIEVWVPDFAALVKAYHAREVYGGIRKLNKVKCPMRALNGWLYGYADFGYMHHGACFDAPYLKHCLRCAGLADVAQLSRDQARVDYGPYNLGARGVKRDDKKR